MCRCSEVPLIILFTFVFEVIARIIDDQVTPKQPNNVTSDRPVAKWFASRKSSHELYAESRIAKIRDSSTDDLSKKVFNESLQSRIAKIRDSSTDGLSEKLKQNERTQVTTKKLDSLTISPSASSEALLDQSLLYPMRSAKPEGGLAFPPVLPLLSGPVEQLPFGTTYV
ncbi:unnamed protein product [Cylicocyclus nassatus]|uniref:Uncharacterized protein n=1 Tax=Cylicocyclus nassatus TaxID=53992 RepID=A0AA36H6F9_CYLNA|nr:unnamed protein product [Cylicocyclus nassatus]